MYNRYVQERTELPSTVESTAELRLRMEREEMQTKIVTLEHQLEEALQAAVACPVTPDPHIFLGFDGFE